MVNKNKFTLAAEQQCKKSPGTLRHGCVIVSNGRILCSGHNYYADDHQIRLYEKVHKWKKEDD